MQLVDKKIGENVEVGAKIEDSKLKLEVDVALLQFAGPLLDKIADLIPGHFEDALIAEAKVKLAALSAAPSA